MTSQLWIPETVTECGYMDVTAELFVSMSQERRKQPICVAVVSDALPETARVRRTVQSPVPNTVRIELDGVENRQYQPMFASYMETEWSNTEIKDPGKRSVAAKAMWDLLHAMGLEIESNMVLPSNADAEKLRLFKKLGKMILGDDCPEQMGG